MAGQGGAVQQVEQAPGGVFCFRTRGGLAMLRLLASQPRHPQRRPRQGGVLHALGHGSGGFAGL